MKNLVNVVLFVVVFVVLFVVVFVFVCLTDCVGEIHHAGIVNGDSMTVEVLEKQEFEQEQAYCKILESISETYEKDYNRNHKDTIELTDKYIMHAYKMYAKYTFTVHGQEKDIPAIKIVEGKMPSKYLTGTSYHCYIGEYAVNNASKSTCVRYDIDSKTIIVYKGSKLTNEDLLNGIGEIMWNLQNKMLITY